MKALASAVALTTLLTSAALAGSPTPPAGQPSTARPGPVPLTAAQLDAVTAGAGSGAINGGGEFITRYGGGVGVDPSASQVRLADSGENPR